MKTHNLFILLLIASVSFGQDTINAISLQGKSLKVEYDDNSVSYIDHVDEVIPEVILKGRNHSGKRVYVPYSRIDAKTKATQTLTLTDI